MIKQEYFQLVKTLDEWRLLEFVKQFFLCRYKGVIVTADKAKWENTYILNIAKNDSQIKRFVHVSRSVERVESFINDNIEAIANLSVDTLYRRLEFFCLSQIQNKERLIEFADLNYGITIVFYDEDVIEDAIEMEIVLRDFIVPNTSPSQNQQTKFNQKDKLLYDLFTTGSKIADIKNSFISSYIQYFLLEHGPQSVSELKSKLKDPLPNLQQRAFEDAISRCELGDIIVFEKGKFKLTDASLIQLEEMKNVTRATEENLIKQFEECLDEYGMKDMAQKLFDNILEIYRAQNNSELAVISHSDDSDVSEGRLVRNLYESLTNRKIDNETAKIIVKRILSIVSESEYLNKVSATTLFTGLFNSNSLEDYLGKQKRIVFLDSQVLFQLLCVDYQPDVPYEDSLFETGRILYNQLKESKNYLDLYTIPEYVREVSNHLYEANNLKQFVDITYIRELGPSKNIFYNFYLYLDENEDLNYACFEDFISEILNTDDHLPNSYNLFVEAADSLIMDVLNYIGIKIQPIDQPSNLNDLRKDYDNLLENHPKSNKARENDVLCMYYLSDQTNFINSETDLIDEPYLITMDTTIAPMRKRLMEHYQRRYWYIYPPLKFANRLSLMTLKLDSKNINYDIICMAETNFKASYETISMLDIMSKFFTKGEVNDSEMLRSLSKMRAEEKKNDQFRDYSEKNNNNLPIDVVFNQIHRHYRQKNIHDLGKIVGLFENDRISKQFITLLKKGCVMISKNIGLDDGFYQEIDKLIDLNATFDGDD